MDFKTFRAQAHRFADWMADYLETVETAPVRSQVMPGDLLSALPPRAPETGEEMDDIFADFEQLIMPGITHWQHPRFLAYFPANSSPPSILAEMLTATLAAQCMLWETSPAANELETRVTEWMRELMGLPANFQGVIQDSASSGTLVALIAARDRATGGRSAKSGLADERPLAVYCSAEAHSSIEKAARIAGYGSDLVRKIAIDDNQAMRPEILQARIAEDRASGFTPAAIVASFGATGLGSVDPLAAIGAIAREQGIYLHVDAAWAGSALLLDRYRPLLAGIEYADSLVTNPHKWLFTNFDCSLLYLRDPNEVLSALSISLAILHSPDGSSMPEYRDLSLPLGRRFRALKLWFVLRSYGAERLRAMIANHIAMAEALADRVNLEPAFELVAGPRFSLFAFRWLPDWAKSDADVDQATELLLQAVNRDGRTYLTRTLLKGRPVIRLVVGQTYTEQRHLDEAWQAVCDVAANLKDGAQI